MAAGWGVVCCSRAGIPAGGHAPGGGLSVIPSRAGRGGMVRCDRVAVDEINQMGRSRRAGSGIMTTAIRVHHEVQQSHAAAFVGRQRTW